MALNQPIGLIPVSSKTSTNPAKPDFVRDLNNKLDPRNTALYPSSKFNTPDSGMINKFITRFGGAGLQPSNRFIVLFHGPNVNYNFFEKPFSRDLNNPQERQAITKVYGNSVYRDNFINFKSAISIGMKERLALACESIILPSKGLMTDQINLVGNGPQMSHVYAENYTDELKATFLCSPDFFERQYFINWLDTIVNRGTHEVAMYSKYAQPWSIIVACLPKDLGRAGYSGRFARQNVEGKAADFGDIIDKLGGRDKASEIYFVQLEHVYPQKISEVELSQSANNQFIKFSVTFRYHRWFDPVVDYNYIYNVKDREEEEVATKLSPFEKFVKTAREIASYAKYTDPRELKGLIINDGLGQLNEVLGEGTVETIASGGQAIDVFVKTDSPQKQLLTNPGAGVQDYFNTLNPLA